MSAVRVAIIGTAGRTGKEALHAYHLGWMKDKAQRQIAAWGLDMGSIQLVSGGAAWADHVAVLLFLESMERDRQPGLTLYLPCAFLGPDMGFEDTGVADWRVNPGRSANQYHRSFSHVVKRDSFADIHAALALGAVADSSRRGFHARNMEVAKAEYVIAFTFARGAEPGVGGTLHTWRHARGTKIHFSLPVVPRASPVQRGETLPTR